MFFENIVEEVKISIEVFRKVWLGYKLNEFIWLDRFYFMMQDMGVFVENEKGKRFGENIELLQREKIIDIDI